MSISALLGSYRKTRHHESRARGPPVAPGRHPGRPATRAWHGCEPGPGGPRLNGMTVELRSPGGVALLTATVLASMVGFVDAYMINVAVPAIGRDLPASVTQVQWVLTGYL